MARENGEGMTRETYSLRCTAPTCRYARLMIPTLPEAHELAERHSETGHAVDVYRETVLRVATVGGRR